MSFDSFMVLINIMNVFGIFELFNKIVKYEKFTTAKNLMKTCKTLLNHAAHYRHHEMIRYDSDDSLFGLIVGPLFIKCCTYIRYLTMNDTALHDNLHHVSLASHIVSANNIIHMPRSVKILTMSIEPRFQKGSKWEEIYEQYLTQLIHDNPHIEEIHIEDNLFNAHHFSFDFGCVKKIVAHCFLSKVPSTICYLQSINLPHSIRNHESSYELLEELHVNFFKETFDLCKLINLKKLTIELCLVKIDLPETVYYLSIDNLDSFNAHLLNLNHITHLCIKNEARYETLPSCLIYLDIACKNIDFTFPSTLKRLTLRGVENIVQSLHLPYLKRLRICAKHFFINKHAIDLQLLPQLRSLRVPRLIELLHVESSNVLKLKLYQYDMHNFTLPFRLQCLIIHSWFQGDIRLPRSIKRFRYEYVLHKGKIICL